MSAPAVSMRRARQTALHTVVMMPSFWFWKCQIFKRRTAIEDSFKNKETNKHMGPGEGAKGFFFLKKNGVSVKTQMLWGSERNLTRGLRTVTLAASERLVL